MLVVTCLFAGSCAFAAAQDATQAAPDNTKVNERDKNSAEPTADQQKNNPSDRDITRQIRQSIMSDKSLSTYGHNVKIISQNGKVTLKGPVMSEEEKQSIEAKAAGVVGQGNVSDGLEIKTKK
jgi:osmotically-inducible protein OsmY